MGIINSKNSANKHPANDDMRNEDHHFIMVVLKYMFYDCLDSITNVLKSFTIGGPERELRASSLET